MPSARVRRPRVSRFGGSATRFLRQGRDRGARALRSASVTCPRARSAQGERRSPPGGSAGGERPADSVSAAAELAAGAAPFLAPQRQRRGGARRRDDDRSDARNRRRGDRPRLRPCGLGPLRGARSGSAADTTGAAESDSSAALERFKFRGRARGTNISAPSA